MTHDELIAALEKATGPDRVLDGDIAEIIGRSPMGMERFANGKWGGGGAQWDAPYYTASIDAALTLVPKEWGWRLDTTATIPELANLKIKPTTIASCIWAKTENGGCKKHVVAVDSNPAIALCIAALKARGERT